MVNSNQIPDRGTWLAYVSRYMQPFLYSMFFFVQVQVSMAQTPVAFYPFNGNAQDAIGTNHGTVNGATLATDRFGIANSAYSFDGVDDDISFPSSSFSAYSLIAWVKFTGSVVNKSIMAFTEGNTLTTCSHQIRTNGAGKFAHYTVDQGPKGINGTSDIDIDIWYHVAITASNNGPMRLYINGIEEGTSVNVGTLWNSGNQFQLGNSTVGSGALGFSNTGFLNGVIDDVKVYNVALTATQVLQEFQDNAPVPGPIAYYPFSGNALDAIGTNHGTVNGATLTEDRFGNANSAYSFDGVDDVISFPSSNFTAYTLSAWVKFTGTAVDKSILAFTQGNTITSCSHQIRTNGTGRFAHYTFDGIPRAVNGTSAITENFWNHVVITASNNGPIRLYVNGIEEGASIGIGTLWPDGTEFQLGNTTVGSAGLSNTSFLNGAIDDVKIYNVALTATQVLQEFQNNAPIQGPVAYYPSMVMQMTPSALTTVPSMVLR
jgi:hypothetical protein